MSILTCTASGYSSLLGSNATKDSIEIYYSSFSPSPENVLNEETTTLFKAYFSYYIYSGLYNDSVYKGDGTVKFYGNGSSTTLLNDARVGYPGVSKTHDVTNYVNKNTGVFSYVYAEMQKSIFASGTIYRCGFTDLEMEYHYIPYKVTWKYETGGASISATLTDAETNTLKLTAYPAEGYKFARWSDGVTTATRIDTITGDTDFVAQFTPNTYTVNYYDITSGEKVSCGTQVCNYGFSYQTPPLPIYEKEIPEGYGINPTGWIQSSEPGSIRYGTSDLYSGTSTSDILTQYTTIYNLTSIDNDVVDLYFNLHPMQYIVTHKTFTGGSTNNFGTITRYRIYGNGDYSLAPLPTTLTDGYKLTNQMTEENGKADTNITNSWFVSEEAMNPGDETAVYIDSLYIGDSTVYSYETPIDYFVHFHTCDLNGEEINLETLSCKYVNSYSTSIPEILDGQIVYGWYSTAQDISTWYVLNSTNEMVNGTTAVAKALGFTFENLTKDDYAEIHYYAYYIPRGYQISYHWLDAWGQGEFALPASGIHVYGRDGLAIATIPNYDEYIIDNVDTIGWYYYENNDPTLTDTQAINEWATVPLDFAEDRIFFALKTPIGRQITFGVNEESWGKVIVENPKLDDIYQEGDIINVYIEATDLAYFSHWSDGNRLPIREIKVGGRNIHYIAYFRSNQIYIQRPITKEK